MGRKNTDGTWTDDCLAKVKPDEPIFVLRAQDKFSSTLVRLWVSLAFMHGLSHEKVREALATADAMDMWSPRKFPD